MDAPPPLPPRHPVGQLLLGMVAANAIGGGLLFVITLLVSAYREHDLFSLVAWPSFFLIPFLVGLIAAWLWRRLNRTLGWSFLDALWTSLVGLAAAAIILREGAVCLVIVSPALYVFILCGILVGRLWFRPNYSKLQLTIFPLARARDARRIGLPFGTAGCHHRPDPNPRGAGESLAARARLPKNC